MRADGWDDERLLALPHVDLDYWRAQARAMERVLRDLDPPAGARLLDVGSNTCWASAIFARRGLEVVALDIADGPLQGLRAAEAHLRRGVRFERLRSVMYDPALADGSFDYVFCSEVLHHNDPVHLRRTLRELHRVLRPGGTLIAANEPLRFPLLRKRDHAAEVAEFDGNEHVYYAHEYLWAAHRAGFRLALPQLREARRAAVAPPARATGERAAVKEALRRRRRGRALLRGQRTAAFAWRWGIRGDAALAFYGRKPA